MELKTKGSEHVMVVYDVVVNGEVKETIKPTSQRLKNIYKYVMEQIELMKIKYGANIIVNVRMVY